MADSTSATQNTHPQEQFVIQNIFVKDVSFESSDPYILSTNKQAKPNIEIELSHKSNTIKEHLYEIVLQITVNFKVEDKTAFIVEVHQAGLFTLQGFTDERLSYMVNSYCLSVLFPYIRELISNLVGRSGFQPLYLAPINFDALYAQRLNQERLNQEKANQSVN